MALSSSRLRLVAVTFAATAAAFVSVSAVLALVSRWAETNQASYPYMAGEDSMRFLLPTVQEVTSRDTVLLGPSSLGEALYYETLQAEWGGRVVSDGISDGTIDDFILVVQFLSRELGPRWRPGRIVIGLDPRVVANIPRHFGEGSDQAKTAFLIDILNRYSVRYKVESGPNQSVLTDKTWAESLVALARFYLVKQQPRYQTGLAAVVEKALPGSSDQKDWQLGMERFPSNFRNVANKENVASFRQLFASKGFVGGLKDWARAYRSAYTSQFYHADEENGIRFLIDRDWADVFAWNGEAEKQVLSYQLDTLAGQIQDLNAEVVIVYLPLHPLIQEGMPQAAFEEMRAAVTRYFPRARIVDMANVVPYSGFVDNVHVAPSGAARATGLLLESVPDGPHPGN